MKLNLLIQIRNHKKRFSNIRISRLNKVDNILVCEK